jgi:hypothetical protein
MRCFASDRKGIIMRISELEELAARLHGLQHRLDQTSISGDEPLAQDHPLVQAAAACEFRLPPRLTVRTLAETVERKIDNVTLMLERAREHQQLPQSAQAAAEQEDMPGADDYRLARHEISRPPAGR